MPVCAAQHKLRDEPLRSLQLPLLFLRGTSDPFCTENQWQALLAQLASCNVQVGRPTPLRPITRVMGRAAMAPAVQQEACQASSVPRRCCCARPCWHRHLVACEHGFCGWVLLLQVHSLQGGSHALTVKGGQAAQQSAEAGVMAAAVAFATSVAGQNQQPSGLPGSGGAARDQGKPAAAQRPKQRADAGGSNGKRKQTGSSSQAGQAKQRRRQ